MGVHGLWRLLDSFGAVLQPEDLRGQRVAIDASIWMAQFRAQTASDDDIENRILEGFLSRILKLLFYGIQPVFVFDGTSSSSKGAEHQRRLRHRAAMAEALLKRRARLIVSAQVAAGSLDVAKLKLLSTGPPSSFTALQGPLSATGGSHHKSVDPDSTFLPTSDASGDLSDASRLHQVLVQRRRSRKVARHERHASAPASVSAAVTRHFLRDAEMLIDGRKRGEARVLHNVLKKTSTSLFMGPRRAVDEENTLLTGNSAIPQADIPDLAVVDVESSTNDPITITDLSKDAPTGEGDEDSFAEVLSVVEVLSSDLSEKPEDVELLSSPDTTPGDSVLYTTVVSSPDSSRTPSSSLLRNTDVLAYFNAPSSSLSPSIQKNPIYAGEVTDNGAAVPKPSSEEEISTILSDSHAKTSPESGSLSQSLTTASLSSASSGEQTMLSSDEDAAVSGSGYLWEPATQRALHSIQCGIEDPHSATPPPDATETTRLSDLIDDDFTPVKWQRTEPAEKMATQATRSLHSTLGASLSDPSHPTVSLATVVCDDRKTIERGGSSSTVPQTDFSSQQLPTRLGENRGVQGGGTIVPTRSSGIIPFELLRIVELLDCCGIPYVLSPGEADAQCAFLARENLVDAVFTEDSDVIVHGATTTLRGFFSRSKQVVAYKQAELEACGITKAVLVALASFLGCDYTSGIAGMGLVSALRAIVASWTSEMTSVGSAVSGTGDTRAVLALLRRWKSFTERLPSTWSSVDEETSLLQFCVLEDNLSTWCTLAHRQQHFPEEHAIAAFYSAAVDEDRSPFQWCPPNWVAIRGIARAVEGLGSNWLLQRVELAAKAWQSSKDDAAEKRAALGVGQRRLTEFGIKERIREAWIYKKQPQQHSRVLAQLRAVQRSATASATSNDG